MATTTAVGGSQIDARSLATQLVAAERMTLDQQVARQSTKVTTQISALGSLMGSMASFKTALASLSSVSAFNLRTATSGDITTFTATANGSAVQGSYDIEVLQLAKAQQIATTPFAGGGSTVVGNGTLTLSMGGSSFSVEITEANSTLAGIRDAINGAADNTGVRATLVQGDAGARLVLSSSTTGAANAIEVSHADGDGGLAQLAYSASAPANYTTIKPAQDAIIRVAGAESTSADNSLEDVIDGVTLTLLKETPEDTPVSLDVAYDSATVTKRVEQFVLAYNALASQIAKLRGYDAASGVAGPMLGDSMLAGIESELRRTLSTAVEGQPEGFQTLAAIGITTQRDGAIRIDATKLQNAMSANPDAVARLFGSEQGVGARLSAHVSTRLESNAALDMRSKTLSKQQQDIQKRVSDIDARMEVRLQAYIRQFTRLDTMLSQLQVTSSYLTQQIESLGNLNKASSK